MPLVRDLFREEISKGINIFFGERNEVVHTELENKEIEVIRRVFRSGLSYIERISPKIAASIREQESLVIKIAGIFKEMLPEKKSITFPSEVGTIGVTWLFPQAIRYVATPSPTAPAYSSYKLNSWDIDLTAGTPAYFFGDGTNFYRTSPAQSQHSVILIFNDGIIEIGSTPKIQQFRIVSEGLTKYGIYTVSPIVEVPIETGKAIYQYPTPMGAIPIFYDKGIMWGFMPGATGTSTIKLLGMVFYEHELFPTFKWVT